MTEAAVEARKAYMREWRKRNKEKVRQINARYWEKKAKEVDKLNGESRSNS